MYVCMYVCMYMYVCMCVYMYVCTCMYVCVCMCIYVSMLFIMYALCHPTRLSLPVLKVGLMIVRSFFQCSPCALDTMSLAILSSTISFKGYRTWNWCWRETGKRWKTSSLSSRLYSSTYWHPHPPGSMGCALDVAAKTFYDNYISLCLSLSSINLPLNC